MKMTMKTSLLALDVRRFNEELNKNLTELLTVCSREFVKAAYPQVPVLTGMARASLRPLGNFLNVAIPITPKTYSRISKGYASGSFLFDYGPRTYKLTFVSSVFHYWMNDNLPIAYKNPQKPTPWNSLRYGINAFYKTLTSEGISYIPLIKNFISRTVLRV